MRGLDLPSAERLEHPRLIAALRLLDGFGLGALVSRIDRPPTFAPDAASTEVETAEPVRDALAAPANRAERPSETTQLALGRERYLEHCASCHGERGEGQPDWKVAGPDGALPAPPHDASGHTWHHADAQLLEIIAKGGTVYMPESKMPGFADRLDADEMQAVLAYLKSMWGPRELEFQAEVSAGWPTATP